MQAYSNPIRESDKYALPDIEVFFMSEEEIESYGHDSIWYDPNDRGYFEEGYYYWFCFPGCLPDSDPIGPFETEEDALEDAQTK